MDLSNMSVSDLRKLQETINQELKKREKQELASAREQILTIAQSVGIPLKELIGSGIRTKSSKVAVQYRNPNDASQQWTGRGHQPNWVKICLAAGKSLDELRI